MWPVQTLTLLLCLTDEEQLFAQTLPQLKEVTVIEATAPAPAPPGDAFIMECDPAA